MEKASDLLCVLSGVELDWSGPRTGGEFPICDAGDTGMDVR